MIAKSYRRGRPWLPNDNAFLLDNAGSMTVAELAAALDRNENSIRSRLGQLGYRFNSGLRGFTRSSRLPIHMRADAGAGFMPTPEQITAGCLEAQSKWSKRERLMRVADDSTRANLIVMAAASADECEAVDTAND